MEVAQATMANPDPRNCKAQGRKIENNDDWNGLRDEVMQKMIDIKAKNPRVKEFLLSTDQDPNRSNRRFLLGMRGDLSIQKSTGKQHLGQEQTWKTLDG